MNLLLTTTSLMFGLTLTCLSSPAAAEHFVDNSVDRSAKPLSNLASTNMIEHNFIKKDLEIEKREISDFLKTKNIFKQIVKLLFGRPEEVTATSREVLGVFKKLLEVVKQVLGQKSRSGSSARTLKDTAEEAAIAGVSILQGYVKSLLANNDEQCIKRYLCQAGREAVFMRDSRELSNVIAMIGGYASSYLLDSANSGKFKDLYMASSKGRALKEDCAQLYECKVE